MGFCLVGTPRCCSFAVPESAQGLPHRGFSPLPNTGVTGQGLTQAAVMGWSGRKPPQVFPDPASDTAPARSVGSHSVGHTGHRKTALRPCSAGARVCRGFPLERKRSVCNDSLLLFPQDAAAAIDNMVRSLLLHHPVLVSLRLAEPKAALCGCEQGDAPGVGPACHGPGSLLLRIRPSTIVPFPAPPLPAVLV